MKQQLKEVYLKWLKEQSEVVKNSLKNIKLVIVILLLSACGKQELSKDSSVPISVVTEMKADTTCYRVVETDSYVYVGNEQGQILYRVESKTGWVVCVITLAFLLGLAIGGLSRN